eukprot:1421952-Pleurochrysis_carterae.AAC.1
MTFGARMLRLSHQGPTTSLPSRVTLDICWYRHGVSAALVVRSALLFIPSAVHALLVFDRWFNDIASEAGSLLLDPLLMFRAVRRVARFAIHCFTQSAPRLDGETKARTSADSPDHRPATRVGRGP